VILREIIGVDGHHDNEELIRFWRDLCLGSHPGMALKIGHYHANFPVFFRIKLPVYLFNI